MSRQTHPPNILIAIRQLQSKRSDNGGCVRYKEVCPTNASLCKFFCLCKRWVCLTFLQQENGEKIDLHNAKRYV